MGLANREYNLDGDLDFFFSNNDPLQLLHNQTSQGSPTLIDVASTARVDFPATGGELLSLITITMAGQISIKTR